MKLILRETLETSIERITETELRIDSLGLASMHAGPVVGIET